MTSLLCGREGRTFLAMYLRLFFSCITTLKVSFFLKYDKICGFLFTVSVAHCTVEHLTSQGNAGMWWKILCEFC